MMPEIKKNDLKGLNAFLKKHKVYPFKYSIFKSRETIDEGRLRDIRTWALLRRENKKGESNG